MDFSVHFFFTAYKPVHYVDIPCSWLLYMPLADSQKIHLVEKILENCWFDRNFCNICLVNTKFARIKMNNMFRKLSAFNNRKIIWYKWVVLPQVKFVDLFWSDVANPDLIFISDVAAHWFCLWFECLYAVFVFSVTHLYAVMDLTAKWVTGKPFCFCESDTQLL
jgi:hypothetical protein